MATYMRDGCVRIEGCWTRHLCETECQCMYDHSFTFPFSTREKSNQEVRPPDIPAGIDEKATGRREGKEMSELRIFDIAACEYRSMTQWDVDSMEKTVQSFGQIKVFIEKTLGHHHEASFLAEKLRLWCIGEGDRPGDGL